MELNNLIITLGTKYPYSSKMKIIIIIHFIKGVHVFFFALYVYIFKEKKQELIISGVN